MFHLPDNQLINFMTKYNFSIESCNTHLISDNLTHDDLRFILCFIMILSLDAISFSLGSMSLISYVESAVSLNAYIECTLNIYIEHTLNLR